MTNPGAPAPPPVDEGALELAAAEVEAARRWLDRVAELVGEREGRDLWVPLERATGAALGLARALLGRAPERSADTELIEELGRRGWASPDAAAAVAAWVGSRGAEVRSALRSGGDAARVAVPPAASLRALVEGVEARCPELWWRRVPPLVEVSPGVPCALQPHRRRPDTWRVTIAGRPVPMTFERTETSETNAARYDRELTKRAPVAAIALGRPLPASPSVEVQASVSGTCVSVELERTRVAIYNTVVRITVTVSIELDLALTRADVRLHEDSDTSS
ncbi:MAG: hypothetical protein IT379_42840 [Deltaproteobacteria bacterium]|nr:hypothetical protein [Deltaproteobacteria bacterium]